jgi:hypothetical protein
MSLAAVVVASILAVVSGRTAAPTRICVVRERDGALNHRPVRVWGEQSGQRRKLVVVKGGAKACATVAPGTWSLEARSPGFGGGDPRNPEACRSSPFIVEVKERETVTVTVAPLGRAPAYYCGWDFH